jgi:hypothetical protein
MRFGNDRLRTRLFSTIGVRPTFSNLADDPPTERASLAIYILGIF